MKIAVPKELLPGERRVAIVPETVSRLTESGLEVLVQKGAGEAAFFLDGQYEEAGARLVEDAEALYHQADVVLKVSPPGTGEDGGLDEVALLREGTVLIAFLQPLTNLELVRRLERQGVTSLSMDAIPRITRAQTMDALSSMATVAGYRAALLAAQALGRFFPMMITAAGTIIPAKGMVLGAGVAGLQAIATARRLGAVMYAYDVRPAVKEQVESLGATFVEEEVLPEAEDVTGYARELSQEAQERERQLIHRHVREMDFVITTAQVPGRRAPLLITEEMVRDMRPGSVIVDLASEMGGNCELTQPGDTVVRYGVSIIAPLNLPSSMPTHASQMYSRNISNLLLHLVKDGELSLDFEDDIVKGCCITYQGRVVHEPTLERLKG